jgi:hypothetical protein
MKDRTLTVSAVREAVNRLIARGQLANPQTIRPAEPLLVIDIDDHVSDEAISGGRVRVVLRSSGELYALARALEETELPSHHLGRSGWEEDEP